jgi:hypothetical protein
MTCSSSQCGSVARSAGLMNKQDPTQCDVAGAHGLVQQASEGRATSRCYTLQRTLRVK